MYKPTYSLLERTVHNVKNLGFYVGTDVGINPHVRYIRPLPLVMSLYAINRKFKNLLYKLHRQLQTSRHHRQEVSHNVHACVCVCVCVHFFISESYASS